MSRRNDARTFLTAERGVSTTVGYAMTLVITTLLLTGLLVAGGDFVLNQREEATKSELEVLGQQIASDLSAGDRLALTTGPDGDLGLKRRLPERVAGANYRIEVEPVPGKTNTYEIRLDSDRPKEEATARVYSTTDIYSHRPLTGGDLRIEYNSVTEQLVVKKHQTYVFQEESGRVVIEAESLPEDRPGSGKFAGHYWKEFEDSAANGTALKTYPNISDSGGTGDTKEGPRLDYEVNLKSTNTYYVWVRVRAPSDDSGNSNSVHGGIEGTLASTGGNGMGVTTDGDWHWVNTVEGPDSRVTVSPDSPGQTTFSVWMREDGTQLDKIVLTTDSSYTPSGDGPQESEW